MIPCMRRATTVGFAVAVFAVAIASADAPVALDKLPKSVLSAVKAKYPNMKMLQAKKRSDDGDNVYTVTLKSDTQILEVSFTPRGKVLETSRKLDRKDLSKIVVLALRKNYPGYKLEEARERTIDPSKTNRRIFVVAIVTAANKKLEVTLDARGSILDAKDLPAEKNDDKPK